MLANILRRLLNHTLQAHIAHKWNDHQKTEADLRSGIQAYGVSGGPDQTDAFKGSLAGPGVGIPVVGSSFAIGNELQSLAQTQDVVMHMVVDTSE